MSDPTGPDAVTRLLNLVADRLESYLDGDETSLETLGESIEEGGFTPDEVQALVMVLRSLTGTALPPAQVFARLSPGKQVLRVASAEERSFLSPDAWGYLLELRGRGSLDGEQFERVIEILNGSGVRPVSVDLARDVATRVALNVDDVGETGESPRGDFDLTH
jgi:uncharacterized protein Smg (DUF494 family)